jgi:hypothetical protein
MCSFLTQAITMDSFIFHRDNHYLRQLVKENVVNLVDCRTKDQVADMFTKPHS